MEFINFIIDFKIRFWKIDTPRAGKYCLLAIINLYLLRYHCQAGSSNGNTMEILKINVPGRL